MGIPQQIERFGARLCPSACGHSRGCDQNHSRAHTVVLVALTTNRKRANLPGNVLLEAEEANLPRQSVVVVSQVSTVEQAQLGEYIGTLSKERVDQILAGMRFLQRLTEHRL